VQAVRQCRNKHVVNDTVLLWQFVQDIRVENVCISLSFPVVKIIGGGGGKKPLHFQKNKIHFTSFNYPYFDVTFRARILPVHIRYSYY
jgi:hypothetical protein